MFFFRSNEPYHLYFLFSMPLNKIHWKNFWIDHTINFNFKSILLLVYCCLLYIHLSFTGFKIKTTQELLLKWTRTFGWFCNQFQHLCHIYWNSCVTASPGLLNGRKEIHKNTDQIKPSYSIKEKFISLFSSNSLQLNSKIVLISLLWTRVVNNSKHNCFPHFLLQPQSTDQDWAYLWSKVPIKNQDFSIYNLYVNDMTSKV